MRTLTPKNLQQYLVDYDYEISIEQAKEIMELLDDCGKFSSTEIQMATDYVVYGEKSIFAKVFN